jgi:hypothetical protein
MIRALVLAALAAGCGVKAPPRPPVKAGEPAARPAAAAPPACEGCGTTPAAAPRSP